MQDFHECPYCGEDLEQWSLRYYRSDRERTGERPSWLENAGSERAGGRGDTTGTGTATVGEGLTLLSLCPNERCGYYVLRYRNGLTHWDRDVEAARLLRAVFADE